jgi:hypothetical protein
LQLQVQVQPVASNATITSADATPTQEETPLVSTSSTLTHCLSEPPGNIASQSATIATAMPAMLHPTGSSLQMFENELRKISGQWGEGRKESLVWIDSVVG